MLSINQELHVAVRTGRLRQSPGGPSSAWRRPVTSYHTAGRLAGLRGSSVRFPRRADRPRAVPSTSSCRLGSAMGSECGRWRRRQCWAVSEDRSGRVQAGPAAAAAARESQSTVRSRPGRSAAAAAAVHVHTMSVWEQVRRPRDRVQRRRGADGGYTPSDHHWTPPEAIGKGPVQARPAVSPARQIGF